MVLQKVDAQDDMIIDNDYLIIRDIVIRGNKVTKDRIIIRELVFEEGDTIKKMDLIPGIKRSRENLLNTSLFNFVTFDAEHFPEERIDIIIDVVERWYIWPVPILELADRNFSTFIKNREWDRVNYGVWMRWNNFNGLRDQLMGKIRLGYKEEYSLIYQGPSMGKKQQHILSGGFVLNMQREITYKTLNNEPVDYRESKGKSQINQNAFIYYEYRRKLYIVNRARIDYNYLSVSDSIPMLNPDFIGDSATSTRYFTFDYRFMHDLRDSKVYPLEGYAFKFEAQQYGLGIFNDFKYPHLKLTGTFFFHQRLNHRFYFANATKAEFSTRKDLPYIFKKGLGYAENLSGYEYYVINGSDYFLTKYFLKFELIPPTQKTIPFLKMEQFNKIFYAIYINLFADAGYVYNKDTDPSNFMANEWQFSIGVGFDLVTYYDQVFRIEYAINKYREGGIFLNIETPFRRW